MIVWRMALTLGMLLILLAFVDVRPAKALTVVDAPHFDAAGGFDCQTCHSLHPDLGSAGYTNICISCHRSGDAAARTKPFMVGDQANPFGIYSTIDNNVSRRYQTSHRFSGGDTNLAAGAEPAAQPGMNGESNNLRTRSSGELTCSSCHNQHSNANGSFLRVANDKDQLCLDCHRSRNVQSHLQGSHPVGVSMATASGSFAMANANHQNSSSDLSQQLNKTAGVVLCSTCHGVHFTDSKSSTVDGSPGFANLSSGDGYLLRTDRRGKIAMGAAADSINICTNCHAGKRNHNGAGQDVQCADCHGAHVQYDPLDPSGSQGINAYLIKRNVPQGTSGSGRIFFRYTGSGREYKNSGNTGVCQGCHAVPAPGGIYPSDHDSTDPKVCNGCHGHNNSTSSFSAAGGCANCHGYPPVASMAGYGVVGNFENAKAEDYAGGGGHHDTHLLSSITAGSGFTPCLPCHPASSHNQGKGAVSRSNVNVNLPEDVTYRFDENRSKRYEKLSMSCSNISCHFKPSPGW